MILNVQFNKKYNKTYNFSKKYLIILNKIFRILGRDLERGAEFEKI